MKKLLLILLLCTSAFAQQKAYKNINNFNGGELSPLVKAREDLSKFHSGLTTMENMIPLPQGAAQKRPGTKYVAESKSNTKIRLLPFEYSTEQAYIAEVGNQYFRFFTNNDVIYEPYGTETLSGVGTPIAHWKCNDNAANTTVTDEEATHAGTASANTTNLTSTDAESTANSAFDLANTYYFTVSDHAELSFGDGSSDTPFSLLAWVYLEDNSSDQYIFLKGNGATSEYRLFIQHSGGINYLKLQLLDASASKSINGIASDGIDDGWHFIAVTYSGKIDSNAVVGESSDKIGIKIYIDYVRVDATIGLNDAGYVAMEDLASDLYIGATDVPGNIWENKIDNVSIWNQELSYSEIASLTGNDSSTVYEIVTPYLTADLPTIKHEQSADVLYLAHPGYEPRKLSRYGDAAWLIEAIGLETGPFLDENANINKTITPSATTGSITLTASGFSPFISGTTAGHLPSGSTSTSKSQTGALFKLVQPLATAAYEEILSNNYTADQTEDVSWMDCGSIAKGVTWYLTTLGTWTGTLEVQRNYTIGAAHGAAGWETVFTFQSTDDRNASANAEETVTEADYRVILTASGDAAEPCQVYFRISDTDHIGIGRALSGLFQDFRYRPHRHS
jgi:hypothetical protein